MPHYYSTNQTSKLNPKKITITLRGITLTLFTDSGVFSKRSVDKGTELLINSMKIKGKVLDMGCGYGIIGLFASKLTTKKVYLVDINKRAIRLTNLNIRLNNLKNTVVKQGNLYEPVNNIKFDTILTNPPQTAGKDICFKIIEHSRKHLNQNGSFELVARHNKGGKHLSEKMKETFNNLTILDKKAGYRVYLSKNES